MKAIFSMLVIAYASLCLGDIHDVIGPNKSPVRKAVGKWNFHSDFKAKLVRFGYQAEAHCHQIVNYLFADGSESTRYELTAAPCPTAGLVKTPTFVFGDLKTKDGDYLATLFAGAKAVPVGTWFRDTNLIDTLCTGKHSEVCDLKVDSDGRIADIVIR